MVGRGVTSGRCGLVPALEDDGEGDLHHPLRAARALEIDATVFDEGSAGGLDQGFAVSPDGLRIAYLSGRTAREVWAVENLLGALPPR